MGKSEQSLYGLKVYRASMLLTGICEIQNSPVVFR